MSRTYLAWIKKADQIQTVQIHNVTNDLSASKEASREAEQKKGKLVEVHDISVPGKTRKLVLIDRI